MINANLNIKTALTAFVAVMLSIGCFGQQSQESQVVITIDPGTDGPAIKNTFSDMNMWDFNAYWTDAAESVPDDFFRTRYPFLKTMQLMTATGGNPSRDLFIDPYDRTVLDDYDFSPLITALRNVIRQGLKPMIKTGAVPLKYSVGPVTDVFGVNVRPPYDYDIYYDYIRALAEAVVAEFGIAEVATWSWGVLTEYENKEWFIADDVSGTMEAYCRLYDYTAAALQDVIGRENLVIGAHSMTCAEGIWDEEDFIRHCARGTNYKTGRRGTQLDFLAASFYDKTPGEPAPGNLSLPETIAVLQNTARECGLTGLKFGIDEGRILSGHDGKELSARVVAHTFQASADAATFKLMNDLDADWFSAWVYNTDDVWGRVDLVSAHVANLCYKMVGLQRSGFEVKGGNGSGSGKVDGMAAYDPYAGKLYVLVYNYNDDMGAVNSESPVINITDIASDHDEVTLTQWTVDDTHGNFWPQWESDMQSRGITADSFSWSMYSTNILRQLKSESDRRYWLSREDVYAGLSQLVPQELTATVSGNSITLRPTIEHHGVVFYEVGNIRPAK